jgi:hypothetical protein
MFDTGASSFKIGPDLVSEWYTSRMNGVGSLNLSEDFRQAFLNAEF